MQTRKEEISSRILREAFRLFSEKGYAATSMREIASASGIVAGNIYNYYRDKDELMRITTAPVIEALQKIRTVRDNDSDTALDMLAVRIAERYSALLIGHREELKVLLLNATGSSLENFVSDYAEKSVPVLRLWLHEINRTHRRVNDDVSDFILYLSTVRLFSCFTEILKSDMEDEGIRDMVRSAIRMELNAFRL